MSWDLLTLVIKEGRSVPCVVLGDAHLREFFHVRTSLDPQRNGHISPFLLGINLMLCAWVDCSEKHSECLRLGGVGAVVEDHTCGVVDCGKGTGGLTDFVMAGGFGG